MAVYTIISTDEQDIALGILATIQKIDTQQLISNLVSDMLITLVNVQKQNFLAQLQEDSLTTLQTISNQITQNGPSAKT